MNNNIPPFNHPHDRPESSRRQLDSAIARFYNKDGKLTPLEQLFQKLETITLALQQHIQPILQAGGGFDKEKEALSALISRMYIEAFDKLSKDELVQVAAYFHTVIALEQIDTDPAGTGTPDKLSGQ